MSVAGDSDLDKRDRRVSAQTNGKSGEAVWRGFINVNLSPDQKSQYEDWAHTDDVWLAMAAAVGGGCHLAVKYVPGEKCFLASLTQRTPGHVNAGLCITARSVYADKSLLRVLFIFRVLGSNESWDKVRQPADPDRW